MIDHDLQVILPGTMVRTIVSEHHCLKIQVNQHRSQDSKAPQ